MNYRIGSTFKLELKDVILKVQIVETIPIRKSAEVTVQPTNFNEFMTDCDEEGMYPHEITLETIRQWDHAKPYELFEFIEGYINNTYGVCAFMSYMQPVGEPKKFRNAEIITGGWSGIEDIIYAMKANHMFWMRYFYQNTRGGSWLFRDLDYK